MASFGAITLLVLTGCDAGDHQSAPSTVNSPDPSSGVATSGSALPSTAPLTVSSQAATTVGEAAVRDAYDFLSAWILDVGFRPELVATIHPTSTQLMPVTAGMTPTAAASLLTDAKAADAASTGNVETLTAVGVRAPHATLRPSDSMVTGRAVTAAQATVGADGNLTITATSSADIHYVDSLDASHLFHSTFERVTTYSLVEQDGQWLVNTWRGRYTTTDPIDD